MLSGIDLSISQKTGARGMKTLIIFLSILSTYRLVKYNALNECETADRYCMRIDATPLRRNIHFVDVYDACIGALFLQPAARSTTTHAAAANCRNRRRNFCSRDAHAATDGSAATTQSIAYAYAYHSNSAVAHAAAVNTAYAYIDAHAADTYSGSRRRNLRSRDAHAAAANSRNRRRNARPRNAYAADEGSAATNHSTAYADYSNSAVAHAGTANSAYPHAYRRPRLSTAD